MFADHFQNSLNRSKQSNKSNTLQKVNILLLLSKSRDHLTVSCSDGVKTPNHFKHRRDSKKIKHATMSK